MKGTKRVSKKQGKTQRPSEVRNRDGSTHVRVHLSGRRAKDERDDRVPGHFDVLKGAEDVDLAVMSWRCARDDGMASREEETFSIRRCKQAVESEGKQATAQKKGQ